MIADFRRILGPTSELVSDGQKACHEARTEAEFGPLFRDFIRQLKDAILLTKLVEGVGIISSGGSLYILLASVALASCK